MKITYIHHSSFLVELEQTLLLFDYTGGPLPKLDVKKDLLVFVSHRHGDHFSPVIFELASRHPRIQYILSDDIWQNKVPDEHYGRIRFVDAGHTIERKDAGNTRIKAFSSTDEGVAFLVFCEGKTIYHAGDLNDWKWNGESKAWNHNMSANYKKELAHIAALGVQPDIAFLPLDGRLEEWFYLGLHEFMEQVGAGFVFPMHFWEDYTVIDRLKALPLSEAYRDKVAEIHKEGESFKRD